MSRSFCTVAVSVAIAAFLVAYAPAPANAQSGCIVLSNPSVCTDWNNYVIRATSYYNDTAQFDTYLQQQMENSTSFVSKFSTLYGCSKWDGSGLRYRMSITCAMTVDQAAFPEKWGKSQQACKNPDSTIIGLCVDTCQTAYNSWQSLFTNLNYCEASTKITETQRSNRNVTLSQYSTLCSHMPIQNNTVGTCFDGDIPTEATSCGYFSSSEGASYCSSSSGKSDQCCSSSSSSSSGSNAGSIAGGVIAALVIIGLLIGGYILYRRRARRSDENLRYRPSGRDANQAHSIIPAFLARFIPGKNKNRSVDPDDRKTRGFTMYGDSYYNAGAQYIGSPTDPSTNTLYRNQYQPNQSEKNNFSNSTYGRDGYNNDSYSMGNTPAPPYSYTGTYTRSDEKSNFAAPPPAANLSAYDTIPSKTTLPNTTTMPKSILKPLNDSVPKPSNVEAEAKKKNRQSYIPELDGQRMRVIAIYLPTMEDEVQLNLNDVLMVEESFDDGWAVGRNVSQGTEGFFPMACCAPEEVTVTSSQLPKSVNKRVSSYYFRK